MQTCPGPADAADQCELKTAGCRRTNPWIQYLVVRGKEGLTSGALYGGYGAADRVVNTKCSRVRNRYKDRDQTMNFYVTLPGPHNNLCTFFDHMANQRAHPFNSRIIRKKIRQEMHKGDVRLAENFAAASLTVPAVNKIIDLIGKYYFGGTRHETDPDFATVVREPAGIQLAVVIANYPPGHGRHNIQAIVDWYHPPAAPHTLQLVINRHKFGASWVPHRRTDNIAASSKLDGLIIAIEHELTHVLMVRVCPERVAGEGLNGHGPTFCGLNANIFGHSPVVHTFTDAVVAPIAPLLAIP